MSGKPKPTTFKPGNKAAQKHGIRALEERGVAAMDDHKMGYFSSLRKQVTTHPGRMELRHDLAAMATLLAKLFFSRATEDTAAGIDIVDSAAAKRVGYHIALADRILSSMPDEDDGPGNITEVLNNDES